MPSPVALLLAVLVQQPQTIDTAAAGSAYLDPAARELVAHARARRELADHSIRSYQAIMKERIGLGIRALRRDRMLYRRELTLRIDWRRDTTSRIDVIGAREAVPAAMRNVQLPEDLRSDAPDYAFDPADDQLQIGNGSRGGERDTMDRQGGRRGGSDKQAEHRSVAVRHPISPGSEVDYRFQSGDTARVTFPDGRTLLLYELRVIPRRQDFRLMSGSVWIEGDNYSIVRILFRLARPFDLEQDFALVADSAGEKDDVKDIPGFLKPIRAEVRFITVEYSLWDRRFWLPRSLAFDATASVGNFLTLPLRYERIYSDYEVQADSAVALTPRTRRERQKPDSTAEARCHALGPVECRCDGADCLATEVHIPDDTAALLVSPELPPAFSGTNDSLISETELEDLGKQLRQLPSAPWQFKARPPRWGLARFNRVEGLSLGARGGLELGRLRVDGTVRLGASDLWPNAELGVVRETQTARFRLAGYRRLAVADPATRGLGIGNSLAALFLGRDDGDYFRTAGAELTGVPAVTLAQNYSWRVYYEHQTATPKETDFSIPHLVHQDHVFQPNLVAQRADEVGAALLLRGTRLLGSAGASFGTDVTVDGATGTFDFARFSLTTRINTGLPGKLVGALETAAGTSAGTVPVQSLWFLGGPNTLRGYGGGTAAGEAFWRVRAEVANAFPAARVALFFDAGRAAPRDALSWRRALLSAGVGASFLDGLIRVDVGRALRSPVGWRVDFYTDGVL